MFVDEIHRLNRQVEEVLYPAMEMCIRDRIPADVSHYLKQTVTTWIFMKYRI